MTPPVVAPPLPLAPGDVRLVPCLCWLHRAWGSALWRFWGGGMRLAELTPYVTEWDLPTEDRVEVWMWN